MAKNTSGTSTAKTSKPRAPRKTAKQRAEEAEQARQAAWAEFEPRRHGVWVELWAKALRLRILTENMLELQESYSWWFEDFHVNAREQCFQLYETGSMSITEASLHPADVDRIGAALDEGYNYITEFEAEKERKRQEAIEHERRRQEALAKLNDEDKKILNLPRN